MKTNNNLKKDFILYNPERKEEDERAKHRDCAYYENRLNIIIGEFSNISSLSVKEFYYDLYSELLDEYKEFLAKKNEAGKVDYSKDFFGKSAALTVSGQLEAETYAMAYKKVYTFGPTFY